MPFMRKGPIRIALALVMCCLCTFAPAVARAEEAAGTLAYSSLEELAGKRFAYVNGSVYNLKVQDKVADTEESFYPSLADCVAAVEAGKADAAVQLSYCCEFAVNRSGGQVGLLPEAVEDVAEAYFFPSGSELTGKFNKAISKFEKDGTIDKLVKKWVAADEEGKTLPEQDWDAPNGTLKFATTGVLEPYSYVSEGGEAKGYDVELALCIAKELGYHLDISTIPMDAIVASVQTGKVDFGGTLTRTDERAEAVDFSSAVMPSTVSVIVKAANGAAADATSPKLEINSLEELDGKRIGILNGTVFDQLIEDNLKIDYTPSYYNTAADMVAALISGKIDAFGCDKPVCELACNQNSGIALLPEPLVNDNYAFFFQKGSGLTAEFDKIITRMGEDGTLEKLREKWMGSDEAAKTLPEQDWKTPNGTLRMATTGTLEPMTYLQGNTYVGYDIEVALLACKELGYGLEVDGVDMSGIIAGVQSGKFDFGGASVSITEARKEVVDFTVPNYYGAAMFVVREEKSVASPISAANDIAESFRRTFLEENRWQLILEGLGVTTIISVCSGILGMLLGYVTVLQRRSGKRWAGRIVDGYQSLMGGIPLVVVLMVLYYVVFGSFDIDGKIVAIMAFTLSFGSTSGSTMWTAVSGLDVIQEECGLALGYTPKQTFSKIIFPQAAQQFMPQLMGQFVSLVKETSIVGFIAVQDLTRASDLIRARTMDAFFPLISTAIIYFIICRLLAWALSKFAARFDVTNKPKTVEGVEL